MKRIGYLLLGLLIAAPVASYATIQGLDISPNNTALTGTLATSNGGTGVSSGIPGVWSSPAVSINLNVAGDNTISIPLPSGFTRITAVQVQFSGASGNISTATFGVFTATGGGGAALLPAGTAFTITTAADNTNNNAQELNVTNVVTESYLPISNQLFVRIGTTVAQTVNCQIQYRPVP